MKDSFTEWLRGRGKNNTQIKSIMDAIRAHNDSLEFPFSLSADSLDTWKDLYVEILESDPKMLDNSAHKEALTLRHVLDDMMLTLARSPHIASFNVKGMYLLGMVLDENKLGYENRTTRDLDMDVLSHKSWEDFVETLPDLFTKNSELGAVYTIKKRRGFAKNISGDSLVFEVDVSGDCFEVKIDMNVTKFGDRSLYVLGDTKFYGASIYAMLGDKLSATSYGKIYRRVKDIYDVFTMSLCLRLSSNEFYRAWDMHPRDLGVPCEILKPDAYSKLEHAFKVFRGFTASSDFDEVYKRTVDFLDPLLVGVYTAEHRQSLTWCFEKGMWLHG